MNIFMLDKDPRISAAYHNDKHVVKMCLEYAQILSTVHRQYGSQIEDLYRATHIHHPSVMWVMESRSNYAWLYEMWKYLAREYTLRYSKVHASYEKLEQYLRTPPEALKDIGLTKLRIAIHDDRISREDPIIAYREYYKIHKRRFSTWKSPSSIPYWFY